MHIDEFCTKLAEQLEARSHEDERLEVAAVSVAKVFGVRPAEVALFGLDSAGEVLSFRWPVSLRKVGAIPLSSRSSLVAKTAREISPAMDNSFSATPHAFYFEDMSKPKTEVDEGGARIQKIMSVPLLSGDKVTGVIQVGRRGETPVAAGKDFLPAELQALAVIGRAIGKYFQLP